MAKNFLKISFFFCLLFLSPLFNANSACEKEKGNKKENGNENGNENENEKTFPDVDDCLKHSSKGRYSDYCCHFDPLTHKTIQPVPFCKTVPYSTYFSGYTKEYIDGVLYNVECGAKQTTHILERCGNTNKSPDGLNSCKKYSSFVNSCCYYSGEKKDEDKMKGQILEKGCYWLGSKYEGKIEWAGVELKCSDFYLKNNLFSLYTFSILFLFLL